MGSFKVGVVVAQGLSELGGFSGVKGQRRSKGEGAGAASLEVEACPVEPSLKRISFVAIESEVGSIPSDVT